MKPSERAHQKNFGLDEFYYKQAEIEDMLKNEEITSFESFGYREDHIYRIYVSKIRDISVKVVDGEYCIIATGINGKQYHVVL